MSYLSLSYVSETLIALQGVETSARCLLGEVGVPLGAYIAVECRGDC